MVLLLSPDGLSFKYFMILLGPAFALVGVKIREEYRVLITFNKMYRVNISSESRTLRCWLVARLVEVKVKVPSEVAGLVRPRKLEDELRLLATLELSREGRVSLGKAAEIAGLSLREFLYELRIRRIPLNYDLEELEEDLKVINELLDKKEKGGPKPS